ncbi:hypothetical protein [Hyphomicrobium sp.]|uniref:hypothetical protein n=1 Tax=Hyphomicrobium sp. TaxID=82 RepID=UPI0025C2455B|nr:hypothetical protein [Hyphomicrobium sp.]MCC7250242.1 hypothetical protein [Hyphomicrobium sp.]
MKATILAVVVLAFSTANAFAVSLTVKLACKDDYFAHCSHHAVGTPGVRKCMRDVGPRLSTRCLGALADAGMIKSKAVAKKYQTKTRVAQKQYSKKRFAKKTTVQKQVASKSDLKKRYASKPSKKRYSKKEYPRKEYARKEYGRKHVALAEH